MKSQRSLGKHREIAARLEKLTAQVAKLEVYLENSNGA